MSGMGMRSLNVAAVPAAVVVAAVDVTVTRCAGDDSTEDGMMSVSAAAAAHYSYSITRCDALTFAGSK